MYTAKHLTVWWLELNAHEKIFVVVVNTYFDVKYLELGENCKLFSLDINFQYFDQNREVLFSKFPHIRS